ncbi:MAG: N-acetyltransferase [Chloroflexota bacterium]
MQRLKIELEKQSDYQVVENLTREAFWNHYVPGCNEHYLLHILRNKSCFIKELDFVAKIENSIVGSIVYTRANIRKDDGKDIEVLCLGPISVKPEFQGKGIGGKLIVHSQAVANELGFKAMLLYGDPAYYYRFDFFQAEKYSIATADNMYADALQACELVEGALGACAGRFIEDSVFEIDEVEAKEFDKNFVFIEKRGGLPTQKRFLEMVKLRRPRL